MRTYYKITSTRGWEMAGAGLGYDELFGDAPRYFWERGLAEKQADTLNQIDDDYLSGTYRVEERQAYDDGRFDDEYDVYAREQLGYSSGVI